LIAGYLTKQNNGKLMPGQFSVTIVMKNYTGDMLSSHIAENWGDVAA
jgi:isocitrate dehydrogenase